MSAFTDDDMNQLKEGLNKVSDIDILGTSLKALLHRLECAEACVEGLDDLNCNRIDGEMASKLIKAWLKSKEAE